MTELNYRIQRQNNLNEIFFDDVAGPGNGRHRYCVFEKERDPNVLYAALLEVRFQEGARNSPESRAGVLESDWDRFSIR
ncbi:MAG: hypothetical protein LBP62_04250 [Clostridiales bacterium]|jgi:hypothetical protein|nr:hypothetical protein [Clostridiales bacterium]